MPISLFHWSREQGRGRGDGRRGGPGRGTKKRPRLPVYTPLNKACRPHNAHASLPHLLQPSKGPPQVLRLETQKSPEVPLCLPGSSSSAKSPHGHSSPVPGLPTFCSATMASHCQRKCRTSSYTGISRKWLIIFKYKYVPNIA